MSESRDLLDFYTNAPLLELGLEADRVRQQKHPGNTVTYTFRDNATDAVTTDGGATTISCTISGATATECRSVAGTTTNIPAGDPVAVKALASYDASTHDAACNVLVSWP